MKCDRCERTVPATWLIDMPSLGVSMDLCDKCKDELGDTVVEFMKSCKSYSMTTS